MTTADGNRRGTITWDALFIIHNNRRAVVLNVLGEGHSQFTASEGRIWYIISIFYPHNDKKKEFSVSTLSYRCYPPFWLPCCTLYPHDLSSSYPKMETTKKRKVCYVVSLCIVPIVYHLVSHKMPYHYYPDISFHISWMKGWTFKRGTGLISWYYLIPGCETIHRGKEGVEYFTSERDAYAAYKRMRSINSEE